MQSRLKTVVAFLTLCGLIVLLVAGLSIGAKGAKAAHNDQRYLNETITTVKQPDGRVVAITRKHLLDFIILKNIEELKQRQILEQPDGR